LYDLLGSSSNAICKLSGKETKNKREEYIKRGRGGERRREKRQIDINHLLNNT
jgi:hypothetical protein